MTFYGPYDCYLIARNAEYNFVRLVVTNKNFIRSLDMKDKGNGAYRKIEAVAIKRQITPWRSGKSKPDCGHSIHRVRINGITKVTHLRSVIKGTPAGKGNRRCRISR